MDSMVATMSHYDWHRSSTWTNGTTAAVGVVALDALVDRALFTDPALRSTAVIDGEIYEAHRERARLARAGISFVGETHAELLLRGFDAEGCGFLLRLQGVFAAALWDGSTGTLTVVTDRFGMRPVYLSRIAGGVAIASEIKAIDKVPGVNFGWDEEGLADFFAFGHFFSDRTSRTGIRAVPAAVCGEYRIADDTYSEDRYFALQPSARVESTTNAIDVVEDALVTAVERRAHPAERLGLSLSGGLDARTILALMPAGRDLKTVSLGVEGSLDHRSSSRLAALSGVPHTNHVLDANFLSHFEHHLREMVRLTDGQYLDQGIVMPTLPIYRRLGIEFLHRGHGGELLHMKKAYAYSLNAEALRADETTLEEWLLSHLTGYMLAGVPDDLFAFDVRGRARVALREALARTQAWTRPVDRVWQLFVNQRLHRETALSMRMFNNFVTVRMPFVDNGVVESLDSLPAEMKLDETLQAIILRRRRPEFLEVTNANTGAAVNASRLTRQIGYVRMRVAAKLGVRGYQPYERLGLWLRRELLDLVRRLVTGDRLLGAGLFNPDALRRLVQQHAEARANHTFLLMALLILALGLDEERS